MGAVGIPGAAEMTDMTIIGGGWSVARVDLRRLPGYVIAVNDAALHAPRWDAVVSMDRLWAENRLAGLLSTAVGQFWIRENALQNLPALRPLVRAFKCDHTTNTFALTDGNLNGTNSGACALNLAWQMRPSRLFLLGFDMNRSPQGQAYWYPPYPWAGGGISAKKYSGWSRQFGDAARAFKSTGCEVFNVNPLSMVEAFEKISPQEFQRMQL